MRIKLPHTPPEDGGCRLRRFVVHRTLLASRAALSFVSFSFGFRVPQKVLPPLLLYKLHVHIVNRDISQQVFWNIFLLVFQSM